MAPKFKIGSTKSFQLGLTQKFHLGSSLHFKDAAAKMGSIYTSTWNAHFSNFHIQNTKVPLKTNHCLAIYGNRRKTSREIFVTYNLIPYHSSICCVEGKGLRFASLFYNFSHQCSAATIRHWQYFAKKLVTIWYQFVWDKRRVGSSR